MRIGASRVDGRDGARDVSHALPRRLWRRHGPRSAWLDIDWRGAPALDATSTAAAGQRHRARRGPAAAVRPRPLRLLAELAGATSPHFAAHASRDRGRPARASAPRRAAGASRSRSPATPRFVDRLLRRARRRRGRAWSATRWAASSPPSWRSASPQRVERLVLVSAAGHQRRATALSAMPVLTGAPRPGGDRDARWAASRHAADARPRPRLRRRSLLASSRATRSGCRRRSPHELMRGRRQARLPAGAGGA